MEIDYINGPKTTEIFGISKYQKEIHKRLENVKLNVIEYAPINIRIKGGYIIDRYLKYPYLVKKNVKGGNIKHITSQEFAYLLKLIKLEKTIVTCYDLIPWIYENNRSLPWRLNIMGLKKADMMITCAEYSKNDIVKYLGYPEDKVHVIYPAIDHNIYYKRREKEILKGYNIADTQRVILYVGSEQPRQNVPLLIKAFGKLKKMLPGVKLLKIGEPQWRGARAELLKLVQELNLQKDIVFIDYVPEEELPKFYNAANLFVYPGLYAGVSMPCLEALACGTPVISSPISIAMEKITFLPEDVSDAGMMIVPSDTDELAKAIYEVLMNDGLREDMVKRGLERVKMLSWDKAAKETLTVYEGMYYGD